MPRAPLYILLSWRMDNIRVLSDGFEEKYGSVASVDIPERDRCKEVMMGKLTR